MIAAEIALLNDDDIRFELARCRRLLSNINAKINRPDISSDWRKRLLAQRTACGETRKDLAEALNARHKAMPRHEKKARRTMRKRAAEKRRKANKRARETT